MTVDQVINEHEMVVWGNKLWIEGMKTEGLKEGSKVDLKGLFWADGTKQHKSATIPCLVSIDAKRIEAAIDSEEIKRWVSTHKEFEKAQARVQEEREKKQLAEVEAKQKAAEERDVNGLVLLTKTVKGTQNEFSLEITGTVINRRSTRLTYVQITFNVYDQTGARVGSALANINGLEAGERWNFRAISFGRGASYKFSELSGF
jgi:hypothetical protein